MKNVFYFIICALAFAMGCNFNDLDVNNLEGPTITSNSGLPIGNVSYTMRELLEEVSDDQLDLQEDSTSFLSLVYRDTAEFRNSSELINIQNTSTSVTFNLPSVPFGPLSDSVIVKDTTVVFFFVVEKNEQLTEVVYDQVDGGTLGFDLSVNGSINDLSYTANIENTRLISTDAAASFTSSGTIDLEGYKTLLFYENDSNRFELNMSLQFTLLAGQTLNPGPSIDVTVEYLDQEYDILYGYVDNDTINIGGQVLQIDFFQDLGESGLLFDDPQIEFAFENTFGVPLGLTFEGIYGVDANDTTYLTGDVASIPQIVGSSTSLGLLARDTIKIDNSNSSIRSLLASSPSQLGFDLTAISNPETDTTLNFVLDSSRITTYIEATLPLEIQLNDVSRDMDFSLGGGLSFDEADSLTLRVVSTNEIPFSVLLDLEVYNENDSLTFVAAENLVIETPFLNVDGSLKQPRKQISDVPIGEEGIIALNEGSRINLKVTLNTPESRNSDDIFVKILADATLDIQLSVVGTLKVDL